LACAKRKKKAERGSAAGRIHDTIGLVTGDTSPETRRTDVTEQESITTPDESVPTPSTAEDKPATKPKASKKAITKTPKRDTKKSSSLTDDEKRLARNAALREWRRRNADRVTAYMTEWRAKRKGKKPERAEPGRDRVEHAAKSAAAADLNAATQKRTTTATKKSTPKKPKKGGNA
jgi:hypothetical protein